jgi:hypothetical protein
MSIADVVNRAFEAFRDDVGISPPLTLRGGNAVDSYAPPTPFYPVEDEPTDAFVEGFAFGASAISTRVRGVIICLD